MLAAAFHSPLESGMQGRRKKKESAVDYFCSGRHHTTTHRQRRSSWSNLFVVVRPSVCLSTRIGCWLAASDRMRRSSKCTFMTVFAIDDRLLVGSLQEAGFTESIPSATARAIIPNNKSNHQYCSFRGPDDCILGYSKWSTVSRACLLEN